MVSFGYTFKYCRITRETFTCPSGVFNLNFFIFHMSNMGFYLPWASASFNLCILICTWRRCYTERTIYTIHKFHLPFLLFLILHGEIHNTYCMERTKLLMFQIRNSRMIKRDFFYFFYQTNLTHVTWKQNDKCLNILCPFVNWDKFHLGTTYT